MFLKCSKYLFCNKIYYQISISHFLNKINEAYVLNIYFLNIVTSNGGLVNLARGQKTWQSSTKYGGVSSRAVDGNVATAWNSKSITHTVENRPNALWYVDFGELVTIYKVFFYEAFIVD